MCALPFASGCAAGVWANASLLHLERHEVPAALREFRRVLQSRGILHVSVKEGAGAEWDTKTFGQDSPRWFTYWFAEELDQALSDAGFAMLGSWVRSTARVSWLIRLAEVDV